MINILLKPHLSTVCDYRNVLTYMYSKQKDHRLKGRCNYGCLEKRNNHDETQYICIFTDP